MYSNPDAGVVFLEAPLTMPYGRAAGIAYHHSL